MKAHPLDMFLAADAMRTAVCALIEAFNALSQSDIEGLSEPLLDAIAAVVGADQILIAASLLTDFSQADLDSLRKRGRQEELVEFVRTLQQGARR